MSPDNVEALLFDVGGVVLEIDFNRAFESWARDSGERPETVKSRFRFDAFYERHERGEIQAGEYFSSLRSTLGIDLSDTRFAAGWKAIYVGVIPGVEPVLRRIATRIPLYAFTNSNPTHQEVWGTEYSTTLGVFRKVFASSEMGLRKPEPEAFAAIAADIGVPLDKILFFDDLLENVEGARAIGLPAVHVRSIKDIERNVQRYL